MNDIDKALIIEEDGTVRVEPLMAALALMTGWINMLSFDDYDAHGLRVEMGEHASTFPNVLATAVWRDASMTTRPMPPAGYVLAGRVVIVGGTGHDHQLGLTENQLEDLLDAIGLYRHLLTHE
jgi:hypothetical protein